MQVNATLKIGDSLGKSNIPQWRWTGSSPPKVLSHIYHFRTTLSLKSNASPTSNRFALLGHLTFLDGRGHNHRCANINWRRGAAHPHFVKSYRLTGVVTWLTSPNAVTEALTSKTEVADSTSPSQLPHHSSSKLSRRQWWTMQVQTSPLRWTRRGLKRQDAAGGIEIPGLALGSLRQTRVPLRRAHCSLPLPPTKGTRKEGRKSGQQTLFYTCRRISRNSLYSASVHHNVFPYISCTSITWFQFFFLPLCPHPHI